jgi:small subunit ribosomal protein S5
MPGDTNTIKKGPSAGGEGAPHQQGGERGGFRKNQRRGSRFDSKVRPEFDQKIIDIRRVTRVVAGGRRFSFSVALIAGDKRGRVGVGIGKAGDTALAIDKALKDAKKNMIRVHTTKTMSIPHEVSAKYTSSRVEITPAPGRGIIAGTSIRNVIELAGLKDIAAKLRSGSKNRLNNARVAIEALKKLEPVRQKATGPVQTK